MHRIALTIGIAAAALLAPRAAHAFCGFYVNDAGGPMFADASRVTLMRVGTRTVLSMQNNYKGPTDAFALVIPVPVVLRKDDVKTLVPDVFDKIDRMGAPRLVEYWEQDPCNQRVPTEMRLEEGMMGRQRAMDSARNAGVLAGVKVEAQFAVGEYQIVILSATDSSALEKWLRQEKYQIPAGVEPLLRPYVASGSKFFVAKVDPKKVKFVDGRVALSPLRFHYDHDEFSLPIRLGLANSSGKQDLIVNILAPGQRYEVANYPNVTVPTNLDVKKAARERFGEFYAALFDRTVEKNPGAVVTEYAWDAATCDPCPGPTLAGADFEVLGADVAGKDLERRGFVLTRLHARYGKEVSDDLVFRAAPPIVGGREVRLDDDKLEEGARPDSFNNFQGRYAIRHEWTGPMRCEHPVRGEWGGPPEGVARSEPVPALDTAFAPRGTLQLAELVTSDLAVLDVKAAGAAVPAAPAPAPGSGYAYRKRSSSGCGCSSDAGADGAALLAIGLVVGLTRRRRRLG